MKKALAALIIAGFMSSVCFAQEAQAPVKESVSVGKKEVKKEIRKKGKSAEKKAKVKK